MNRLEVPRVSNPCLELGNTGWKPVIRMPPLLQHLLVLLLVGLSAVFVLRQGFLSLRGRKSKLGSCGSCGGCATPSTVPKKVPLQFLPVEALLKKK